MLRYLAAIAIAAAPVCGSQATGRDVAIWSPDHQFYVKAFYVPLPPGQERASGSERARLIVYSAQGQEVATAHVWNIEPDGTTREEIRGCENFGWVDNARIYCAGTVNPRTMITLIFDAQTGRELPDAVEMKE